MRRRLPSVTNPTPTTRVRSAALAPVVAYRAQLQGMTAEQLAAEVDKVGKEPAIDGEELNDCARLAVEPKK